jgi:hypothetical protein
MTASFHLCSCSITAPTPFCAEDPTPSPSESGPGTRSSPSGASRPARLWTPSLAARVAAADRRARAQAVPLQPSGSRFQTRWFLLLHLWHHLETVPEPFSYPTRRFLHTRDWRCLHGLLRSSTCYVSGHRHRGFTSDLFSFQPRPELGGSPVETRLHPWLTAKPVLCTLAPLYSPCIYSRRLNYGAFRRNQCSGKLTLLPSQTR